MSLLSELAGELDISPDELRAALLGGDEALQANYLTVDTTGRVSADFTGHVHAGGLDLDAATTGVPPANDKVRWIRQSDGSVIAEEQSYSIAGHTLYGTQVHIPTGAAAGDDGVNIAQVTDDGGAGNSNLTIQQKKGSIASLNSFVKASVGAASVTVLDGLGNSTFIGAASFGSWSAAWGTGVAVFNAVNNVNVTINHNIGKVPVWPDAIAIQGGVFGPFASVVSTTINQVTFNFLVSNFGVITANVSFFWLVIA